ncbi:hypothetical protein BJV78DRAFT_696637 [Lactifluus subvellereus]|nr:hypothetical protein BJV78DRAFT_696637 [Lactifluus subvellereus]
MAPLGHPDLFSQELSSLSFGYALWEPSPSHYDHVSIGDVGYAHQGYFIRMFNVLRPPDNSSKYKIDELGHMMETDLFQNTRTAKFDKGNYCSRHVSAQESRDDMSNTIVLYTSKKNLGAFLNIPYDGQREDVIRTKVFEDYFREHISGWFALAQKKREDVRYMEDIILVTGCTLVTSWAMGVFPDKSQDVGISLKFEAERGNFLWDPNTINPGILRHDRYQHPSESQNQCVFIRGFRGRRLLFYTFLKAAAEPLPDDPDNRREDEIQVTRVPNVPSYRDPLIGVLDYIAEKCPEESCEDVIAIAHYDDLGQFVGDVVGPNHRTVFYTQVIY